MVRKAMHNFAVHIVGWCRRHIILTNLIVLVCEVVLAVLIWFVFNGSQAFGSVNSYAFIWLSIVIASVAALSSMFGSVSEHDSLTVTTQSLERTTEALELTRATTRPFLNVSTPKSIVAQSSMELVICNTGNIPADRVEILCTLCTMEKEEVVKEYELTPWTKQAPSIYFPGDEVGPHYSWSPKDYDFVDDETRRKTTIRVTIDYRNKLTQKTHTTNRMFMAGVSNQAYIYQLVPIPPKDYWD